MASPSAPRAAIPERATAWLFGAGLLAVLAAYLSRCAACWHYVNDDAFITFRYTRFLALGNGPFFNVGEHVEGYTNFLLMLLLVPVYWLGGEDAVPLAAKWIGVASGAGSIALAAVLVWRLAGDHLALGSGSGSGSVPAWLGVATALFVATSPGYALNSTSGLETMLFCFFVTTGVWLVVCAERRGRWAGAGLAFGALALTRPEGALLFAVTWVALALVRALQASPSSGGLRGVFTPSMLVDASIVTAVVVAHSTFRYLAYDGELLPNTFFAKAGGFWGQGPWAYIAEGAWRPFFGVVGVALGATGLLIAARRAPILLVVVAPAATGALLPFVTGTDWMLGSRLVVPYLPLLAVVTVFGWAALAAAAMPRFGNAFAVATVLAAMLSFVAQYESWEALLADSRIRSDGHATGHEALADWMCGEVGRPDDWIALMDIGIVGYRCIEQHVIDITGLTDRHIAKSPGAFLRKQFDPAYLLDQAPRFFVIVFRIPGAPDEPPARDAPFYAWTDLEGDILSDPVFRRRYVHERKIRRRAQPSWVELFAAQIGAVRVFERDA